MAKIALQKIIWHSQPVGDAEVERVEVALDGVVPKTVPLKVQDQWLAAGIVRDDPSVAMPDKVEGPPSMLLPVNPNVAPPPNKTQINKLTTVS